MKVLTISYSNTGNNEALASRVAHTLGGDHIRITETKPRKMGKIVLDTLTNRVPQITFPAINTEGVDLVLFIGPVWMGKVASPFRACFHQLRQTVGGYAYLSVNGGADGPNPKLREELTGRLGKAPACVLELHLADLLPAEPHPTRDDTMAYRINDVEATHLAETAIASLKTALTG